MNIFQLSRKLAARLPKRPALAIAPIDAIWPPLVLMALAISIGSISAWFGIKSLMVLATIAIAILIGDVFGRSKDYFNARMRFGKARDEADRYEVVRRFRRAWCARVACQAAWKRDFVDSTQPKEFVSQIFHDLGYRWWHIFPDLTFTRHSPFIKTAFWVHLFTGKMKRDSGQPVECDMEPAE